MESEEIQKVMQLNATAFEFNGKRGNDRERVRKRERVRFFLFIHISMREMSEKKCRML